MTSDPFTHASPTYRNAARLGARPLPLGAWNEVATYPRRLTFARLLARIAQFAFLLGVLWAVAGFLFHLGTHA